MGYLGNLLALLPDYRDFDAVIAHGDSLLLGFLGKPVLRVMHGSALRRGAVGAVVGPPDAAVRRLRCRSWRRPPCSAASSA